MSRNPNCFSHDSRFEHLQFPLVQSSFNDHVWSSHTV